MLFIVLYVITYWSQINPPIRDLIAPFATLNTISYINGNIINYKEYSLGLGLLYDCYADYRIGSVHLKYPVLLFSFGHIFKLVAFVLKCYDPLIISGVWTNMILVIIQLISLKKKYLISSLFSYGLILLTNLINISLLLEEISISYLLFIISDLIILVDSFYYRIPYRKIRVLLVPVLYLLSQKILINEFKKI